VRIAIEVRYHVSREAFDERLWIECSSGMVEVGCSYPQSIQRISYHLESRTLEHWVFPLPQLLDRLIVCDMCCFHSVKSQCMLQSSSTIYESSEEKGQSSVEPHLVASVDGC
jgi:hypothetical protein